MPWYQASEADLAGAGKSPDNFAELAGSDPDLMWVFVFHLRKSLFAAI